MQATALSPAALEVESVQYDWSESVDEYGEASWDSIAVPICDECGEYARWDNAEHEWICENEECDLRGGEVDPLNADGPMMNYYYPLPRFGLGWYQAADKIRDLPLCLVYFDDDRTDAYALALTGGGMDLSWEICEAFMRLGYLPPAHFADLPSMAGVGETEREREIVAACVESLTVQAERLSNRAEHMKANAGRLAERYSIAEVREP